MMQKCLYGRVISSASVNLEEIIRSVVWDSPSVCLLSACTHTWTTSFVAVFAHKNMMLDMNYTRRLERKTCFSFITTKNGNSKMWLSALAFSHTDDWDLNGVNRLWRTDPESQAAAKILFIFRGFSAQITKALPHLFCNKRVKSTLIQTPQLRT